MARLCPEQKGTGGIQSRLSGEPARLHRSGYCHPRASPLHEPSRRPFESLRQSPGARLLCQSESPQDCAGGGKGIGQRATGRFAQFDGLRVDEVPKIVFHEAAKLSFTNSIALRSGQRRPCLPSRDFTKRPLSEAEHPRRATGLRSPVRFPPLSDCAKTSQQRRGNCTRTQDASAIRRFIPGTSLFYPSQNPGDKNYKTFF